MAPPQEEEPPIITITHTSSLDFTIYIPDFWHGPRPSETAGQQPEPLPEPEPEPEPDWQKRWEELRDKDFEIGTDGRQVLRDHVRLKRRGRSNRSSSAIEKVNGQKSAAEARYTLKEFLGVDSHKSHPLNNITNPPPAENPPAAENAPVEEPENADLTKTQNGSASKTKDGRTKSPNDCGRSFGIFKFTPNSLFKPNAINARTSGILRNSTNTTATASNSTDTKPMSKGNSKNELPQTPPQPKLTPSSTSPIPKASTQLVPTTLINTPTPSHSPFPSSSTPGPFALLSILEINSYRHRNSLLSYAYHRRRFEESEGYELHELTTCFSKNRRFLCYAPRVNRCGGSGLRREGFVDGLEVVGGGGGGEVDGKIEGGGVNREVEGGMRKHVAVEENENGEADGEVEGAEDDWEDCGDDDVDYENANEKVAATRRNPSMTSFIPARSSIGSRSRAIPNRGQAIHKNMQNYSGQDAEEGEAIPPLMPSYPPPPPPPPPPPDVTRRRAGIHENLQPFFGEEESNAEARPSSPKNHLTPLITTNSNPNPNPNLRANRRARIRKNVKSFFGEPSPPGNGALDTSKHTSKTSLPSHRDQDQDTHPQANTQQPRRRAPYQPSQTHLGHRNAKGVAILEALMEEEVHETTSHHQIPPSQLHLHLHLQQEARPKINLERVNSLLAAHNHKRFPHPQGARDGVSGGEKNKKKGGLRGRVKRAMRTLARGIYSSSEK